jgi:uncharacterized membrane protein YbhN (UPF0104 family)
MMNPMNPIPTTPPETHPSRPWWPALKRVLNIGFLILVGVMLILLARRLDWHEVLHTLRSYELSTLLLAAGAVVLSYGVYSLFDLLGRFYTSHSLPTRQVLLVTFVCYAFNLNLGSWVGAVALRYRLYSRLGLDQATITRVLSLSLLTNWMSYLCLAGAIFASGLLRLPPQWGVGDAMLQLIGVLLLALALLYYLLCAFSPRRSWTLRGHVLTLPNLRLASIQLLLGASNWSLMALVIFLLMPAPFDYPTILGVLLISSIAGVITHIPAGLGVLEAVFVALLHHQASKGSLLAGLIGYRVLYYLIPLLIALPVYLVLEAQAKKLRGRNAQPINKAG